MNTIHTDTSCPSIPASPQGITLKNLTPDLIVLVVDRSLAYSYEDFKANLGKKFCENKILLDEMSSDSQKDGEKLKAISYSFITCLDGILNEMLGETGFCVNPSSSTSKDLLAFHKSIALLNRMLGDYEVHELISFFVILEAEFPDNVWLHSKILKQAFLLIIYLLQKALQNTLAEEILLIKQDKDGDALICTYINEMFHWYNKIPEVLADRILILNEKGTRSNYLR